MEQLQKSKQMSTWVKGHYPFFDSTLFDELLFVAQM